MPTFTLDTHKAVKRLMAAGATEKLAEALVEVICAAVRTRTDLPLAGPPCDTRQAVKNLVKTGCTEELAAAFVDVYCAAVGYRHPAMVDDWARPASAA